MAKPSRTMSVTDAARGFADVVNRAFFRNETTVLLKNGVAVAHVAPVAPTGIPAFELLARWSQLSHLTPAQAEHFAQDLSAVRAEVTAPRSKWE